jgi:hypothetical protein
VGDEDNGEWVVTLLDWQGSYNGLTLGGPSDNVGIVSVHGWLDLPEIRSGDSEFPGRAGLLGGRDFPGGRTVTLELEVFPAAGETLAESMDTVNTAFMPQESDLLPLELQLPGQDARLSYCRPRKRSAPIDLEFTGGIANIVVQLDAPNPRIYAAAASTDTINLPTPSSGMTFPATFPLSFGGTVGGGGLIHAANLGNYPTAPVATITGPCNHPRIANNDTGETLELLINLGSTDVLEVDFDAHTVILNGTGYRYSSVVTPGWFTLAPGATTTLGFHSSDPSPTAATLTLVWRSAWL